MTAGHVQRAAHAAALAAAMALGGAAFAAPITLNYSGVVSQTSFDPFDPLEGVVVAGSRFYAYLNFDTVAVDAEASPHLGSYTLGGFPYGVAAVVGPVLFPLMHNVNISVVDGVDGGPDQYAVFAWEGTAGGLGDYFSISMLLQDDSGMAIDSDALPTVVPDLSRFSVRTFTLAGQYTDMDAAFVQYEVQGNLTVPEPAAVGLVAVALLGCAAAGRGRRPRPAAA
ncbi:hypothetical protein ACPOLB_00705 [Rubrivivax sp. RP6-9]|uniref:hypothetical protein n=1 Tax=Rubrivivax sp. RP6-9 TaxID=3415750 RepID=UPI003CC5B6FE